METRGRRSRAGVDRKRANLSNEHAGHALVPALDDLPLAERDAEPLGAIAGAVELLPCRSVCRHSAPSPGRRPSPPRRSPASASPSSARSSLVTFLIGESPRKGRSDYSHPPARATACPPSRARRDPGGRRQLASAGMSRGWPRRDRLARPRRERARHVRRARFASQRSRAASAASRRASRALPGPADRAVAHGRSTDRRERASLSVAAPGDCARTWPPRPSRRRRRLRGPR